MDHPEKLFTRRTMIIVPLALLALPGCQTSNESGVLGNGAVMTRITSEDTKDLGSDAHIVASPQKQGEALMFDPAQGEIAHGLSDAATALVKPAPQASAKQEGNVRLPSMEINRFYFDGIHHPAAQGSSLDEEMKRLNFVARRTFYTPADKTALYLFSDERQFASFIQAMYPDYDMDLLGQNPARNHQSMEDPFEETSEDGRTEACGNWADFSLQWLVGGRLAGSTCSISQTYVMNFTDHFGGVPSELGLSAPVSGTISASIHWKRDRQDCPFFGPCYAPLAIFIPPDGEQWLENRVYNGWGGSAPGESMWWSFTRVIEELYIARGTGLYAIDYTTGAGHQINLNQPYAATAMTSTGGHIYSTFHDTNTLHKMDPSTHGLSEVSPGTGWYDIEVMAALNGYLYVVEGGTLWRVNASNGAVAPFSDYPHGWEATEAMAALGGNLYAVQAGTLWRVTISNGDVVPFSAYPNGWEGTEAMAASGGYLYAVQAGTLWRVNLSNGSVAPFSAYPNGWEGTVAMTAKDGFLFAVQASALWKVSTSNGSVSQLGGLSWDGTTAMAARL